MEGSLLGSTNFSVDELVNSPPPTHPPERDNCLEGDAPNDSVPTAAELGRMLSSIGNPNDMSSTSSETGNHPPAEAEGH